MMHKSNQNLRPAQKQKTAQKEMIATRTQYESWQKILSSGRHEQRRYQAVSTIHKLGPKTCRELSEIIDCEPGDVTAALHTLKGEGVLVVNYEKFNPDKNRWCALYELNRGGEHE